MLIKTLPVGHLETNCYIVTDEASLKCAIIDPGADGNVILDYIEANNLTPEAVFLTHGHFDHHMALQTCLEETFVPGYAHAGDINAPGEDSPHKMADVEGLDRYKDGDVIRVGNLEFTVIETPGHSAGSVTLKCEGVLFTGDTLFRDSCGRTDLGGNMDVLLTSLRRLAELPGDYEVYPGHAESTTLERERNFNYYMRHATGEIQPK